jgi:hypothetical protein
MLTNWEFAMRAPVLVIVAASLLLPLAPPARAQVTDEWDVWVDQNHCADTRAGWLAVAKQSPGYGWSKMPGAPTSLSFMEAIANMDAVRISGPFQNYCCKFVVWRQSTPDPDVLTLVRENDVAPAPWISDSVPMCGETAILQSGMDDVLGALTLPLGSVPGTSITITASGPVPTDGTPVTIPSVPPITVSSPGAPVTPPPPPLGPTAGGDDGGGSGGGGSDAGTGGGGLPAGTVAQVEGALTLYCERVDMEPSQYEGYMILYFLKDGAIGPGTLTLVDRDAFEFNFDMQTQLMGNDLYAIGTVQRSSLGIGSFEVTVTGNANGGTPAGAQVKASISMASRFANGRTPGDGTCTGVFPK